MTGRNAACRECGGNEAGDHGQHRLPIGLAIGSVERALLVLTTSVGAASS